MDAVTERLLAGVKLGKPRSVGPLTLVPITAELPTEVHYRSLRDAIADETLTVAEVSESGSVPDLRAKNAGDTAVIIVDGEELVGAKQNRVLNTTVLIGANTEILIPVSCVEQGRWSSRSALFAVSPNISPHRVRHAQRESVTLHARAAAGTAHADPAFSYRSDQGRVWDEVADFSAFCRASSPTGAMHDSYEARRAELNALAESAKLEDGQNGLFAVFEGRPIGFDVVSRPEAYASLHDKLVRSYATCALGPSESTADTAADDRAAREFLAELGSGVATEHESPGLGLSHRYTSDGFVGSALVVDDEILHAAFFATPE
jgi:hypothetical protein